MKVVSEIKKPATASERFGAAAGKRWLTIIAA
jgi:hypothetical protein